MRCAGALKVKSAFARFRHAAPRNQHSCSRVSSRRLREIDPRLGVRRRLRPTNMAGPSSTRAECQRRLTVRHSHGRHRSAERDGAHGGLEQVRRPLTGHEGARPNTPAIALEPPPKDPFRTPPINVSGRARAIVCCRSSARVEQRARPLFVFDRSNVPRIASLLTRRSDPLHLFVLVVRLSAGAAGAHTLLAAFALRRVDRAGRGDALAHARRARGWL